MNSDRKPDRTTNQEGLFDQLRDGGTVIDSTVWGYANSNGHDRHCREIPKALVAAGADPVTVTPFPSGHPESDQVLSELRDNSG